MSSSPQPIDFDRNPTVPVDEYDETVRRVNVGYELMFELTHALLRSLDLPELDLLVVGAGGGMEVATCAPANPSWRITGVDPSEKMLAAAQAKADALGVGERVALVRGTVEALPAEARFDAATCIFVIHFIPSDEAKLALLRDIAERLRPGAPLILVTGVRDHADRSDEFEGAWWHYGVARGMPPERMAELLEGLRSSGRGVPEEQYVALLREVDFASVTRLFSAFTMRGWIAR